MNDDKILPTDDDNIDSEPEAFSEDEFEPDDLIADDLEQDGFSEDAFEADDIIEDDLEQDEFSEVEFEAEEDDIDSKVLAESSNEMDIDAALAAVSQLTLLAEEDDDDAIVDGDYQPIDDNDETHSVEEPLSDFDLPQSLTMRRGQLASVIPALGLIALGGWLTFSLTTGSVTPSIGLLMAVGLLGVGAMFLAQWLTSGRWSRGNFLIGSSIFLIGAVQLYLSQVSPMMASHGWALWIVAVGLALFGAGFVTLPRLPRLSIMGILIMVTGGIGYAVSSGAIDPTVVNFISNLWFVGVALLIFMLVAPLVRRRS